MASTQPLALKSKIAIDQLFKEGKSLRQGHWSLRYQKSGIAPRLGFLALAPKKHFPKAVDRNRVKRICREIVRRNTNIFDALASVDSNIHFSLSYRGPLPISSPKAEEKIVLLLRRFVEAHAPH